MTERCSGRYPVPMNRDEPFGVTYRCGLHQGHQGECGSGSQIDQPSERCGQMSGGLSCDRERGHEGNHRGYNAQIDEPMFWPPTGATPTAPWTCVMDFPTAWAFIREQHPDPKEHAPRCSWVQAQGGILCDCHVLNDEYARRKSILNGPAGGARACEETTRMAQSTGTSQPSVSSEGSPSPAEAQRTKEEPLPPCGHGWHWGAKCDEPAKPETGPMRNAESPSGVQELGSSGPSPLRSPAEAQGWQPVESAPKDHPVLVRTADAIAVAEWHEDKYGERFSGWTRPPWPIDDAHPVTSWREIEKPLPPAPPTEEQ